MNKKTAFLFMLLVSAITASGQECVYFYPHVKGAELAFKHFDKNGKVTGRTEQELTSYEVTASGSKGEIIAKMYDAKDELTSETMLHMRCEEGIFYFDMMQYVNQETMDAYEGMEMKVDASDVEFPSHLKVGDKLNDAHIKMTVNTGVIPLNFSVSITDRVVEAEEKVSTAAGTFDAYKISQTNTVNFGFQVVMQTTEWYSKDVGMVKTVSYKNGKPASSTELVSIKY